jgi:hypothetical protein
MIKCIGHAEPNVTGRNCRQITDILHRLGNGPCVGVLTCFIITKTIIIVDNTQKLLPDFSI